MTWTLFFLCLKVFCSRILDVSLGTMRTICIVRGKSALAALIGFTEVLIWFMVVREAFNAGGSALVIGIFYAGGYAMGTLVGGKLAKYLVKGTVCMQVVTSRQDDAMIQAIREAGYAISVLDVKGSKYGECKYMLFAEIDGRQQESFRQLIKSLDEKAFIVVQESKSVYNGYFKK